MSNNDTLFFKPTGDDHFESADQTCTNRGMLFGDGIFETMLYLKGRFRFKEYHIERAQTGAALLQLSIDIKRELHKFEVFLQQQESHTTPLRVRWNIYRNGLGKYTPTQDDTQQLWIIEPFLSQAPQSKEAYIHEQIFIPALPWSNCKTLNAMPYVQAGIARRNKGLDEVILLNAERKVCEAGAANLFWKKNDNYYTPSLKSNCIAGVGRSVVLEALRENGIGCREGQFEVIELLQADQVFTTNITGIHYIKKINSTEFDFSPIEFIENIFNS